jgi:hypothetical protein
MTMISEYNAMQAPEANEHDAHAALASRREYAMREHVAGVPMGEALDAYDRKLRAERLRRALFD